MQRPANLPGKLQRGLGYSESKADIWTNAHAGNLEEVKKFVLEHEHEVDSISGCFPNGTAMHEAARAGHANIVEFLVDHEASLNIQDDVGNTPLHCASRQGHLSVVELLISKGAAKDIENFDGWTAWQIAAIGKKKDIMAILPASGQADVETFMKDRERLRAAKASATAT